MYIVEIQHRGTIVNIVGGTLAQILYYTSCCTW